MTYASKQGRNKDERQTGFALHQEKRGSEFRSIIQAPPGYTLMEFDASGQEFRWMAILSGDPVMLDLCRDGEDMHAYMGAQIVGRDYRTLQVESGVKDSQAEKDRYLGKVANLSLQYRTFPKKLRSVARVQYGIPMELPEAQRIHRTYQQTYPQVPEYWKRQIRLVKSCGYAETLAGRRVQVVGDWDGAFGWSMESTSLNYPVQGTGADQKYLALSVIKPFLTQIGGLFAWDLHDGIYLWIPDDKVETAAHGIKRLLKELPYEKAWEFTPPIPLPWDCKYGKGWGALKTWKD
jgi:DNA polymerase-1